MLFNSLAFLVFLPLVYALYLALGHRWQNRMLLVASYVFYGAWDVRFLFLIVASTAIDYCCGLLIERGRLGPRSYAIAVAWCLLGALGFLALDWRSMGSGMPDWSPFGMRVTVGVGAVALLAPLVHRHHVARLTEQQQRRVYVGVSVVANLGLLGFFKYFDFFITSAEDMARYFGLRAELLHLSVVLPVGISFYTFQTMSYSLDIWRGQTKATERFLDFALFVAFFPQLVAGPIERASHLLPQVLSPRRPTYDQSMRGLNLLLIGFFKKVGIADSVADSVDSVYASIGSVTSLDVWAATFLFAVQIYCDFSGYSDIARGCAKLMGFDLMANFDQPYVSTNPSEFWRRWHISLSTWLRDYLYIPLGGNRLGPRRTYVNLMTTMLLGGLWHGAAWNFVLWGGYHGGLLATHRFFTRDGQPFWRAPRVISLAAFFALTCYGWLLFRADSLQQVLDFTWLAVAPMDLSLSMKRPTLAGLLGMPLMLGMAILSHRAGTPRFYRAYPAFVRGALYASMLLVISFGMSNAQAQFIYFQF